MIDFDSINETAISRLPDLLSELLPGGTIRGREYICGDLGGHTGSSLSVNLDSGKWADFANKNHKGGDPISLVAAARGVSQGEVARILATCLEINPGTTSKTNGKRTPPTDTWKTLPADHPPASIIHPTHGCPSTTWEYRGPAGELLGYACRFDLGEGKKEIMPFIYGTDTATGVIRWRWKSWPAPRPLYGLDRLAQRQDSPILIVEGEKACDAAQRMLPTVVAIIWPGGSGAVSKAEWAPLKDRPVAIWPDADEPGRKAAEAVAHAALQVGAKKVFIIDVPPGKAAGWDLADAEAESWTSDQVHEWIKEHRHKVEAPTATSKGPESMPDASWPKPLPLIVHHQAVPYPLGELPGTIGAAVREVVEFVQCPVALGACSILAVVSTVAQGLTDVRRADKLEGPTSLFLLALADSGERKTTVDGFFSKPVQQWEAEQAEAAKPEIKAFEAEKEIFEAKKAASLQRLRIKPGPASPPQN